MAIARHCEERFSATKSALWTTPPWGVAISELDCFAESARNDGGWLCAMSASWTTPALGVAIKR